MLASRVLHDQQGAFLKRLHSVIPLILRCLVLECQSIFAASNEYATSRRLLRAAPTWRGGATGDPSVVEGEASADGATGLSDMDVSAIQS